MRFSLSTSSVSNEYPSNRSIKMKESVTIQAQINKTGRIAISNEIHSPHFFKKLSTNTSIVPKTTEMCNILFPKVKQLSFVFTFSTKCRWRKSWWGQSWRPGRKLVPSVSCQATGVPLQEQTVPWKNCRPQRRSRLLHMPHLFLSPSRLPRRLWLK